jgi:hypothetical protein
MKSTIEERINELFSMHKEITADIVIEDAKNPDSPLHGCFEWDLEKAAMEAWRETARRLIRSVTIVTVVESHSIAVPRYVRTPDVPSNVQSYSDTTIIKTDKELVNEVIRNEINSLESCVYRVQRVCIALDVNDEVGAILKAVNKIKAKI